MSYTEKIDVLDLLIKILQDHERKIDELVERLEAVTHVLSPRGEEPRPHGPVTWDEGPPETPRRDLRD